jgi:hypothetical protein
MLRREEWRTLESYDQQFVFLCDFAQVECGAALSGALVAGGFAKEASHLWKIRSKSKKRAKPPRRFLKPPLDEEDAIVDLIER